MGRVYLARDLGSGERVVVKVMHDKFKDNPRFHELFEREMTFMRQFKHPHVVALNDTGVDPVFGPCIVMEYLEGLPLCDLLDQQGRLTPGRVGRLLVQLCSALQAASDMGIIHRDLKPSNLMIVNAGDWQEQLKVLDFGLAKLTSAPHLSIDELKGSERRIVAVGTPEYICPEQIRGNEVDHRGDIYSVGVVLYEMLTGRRPFDAETPATLFELHSRATPPSFADVGVTDVDPAVEAVVMRCLHKYPHERPQSARALAELFEAAQGKELSEADLQMLESQPSFETHRSVRAVVEAAKQPFTEVFHLQAWMPEKIAILKLRGFLEELKGDVVETEPGLVKVRFKVEVEPPPPPPPPKVLVWLRLAPKPAPPVPPDRIKLDIYLEKKDPNQPNLLSITAILNPGEESNLVRKKLWKKFCDTVEASLSRYLIAERVSAS